MFNSRPSLISMRIAFFLLLLFAVSVSCDDQVDVNKPASTEMQKSNSLTTEGRVAAAASLTSCGGSFNGSYTTINSYYTYPLKTIDVSCAASGATITVSVTALDVP